MERSWTEFDLEALVHLIEQQSPIDVICATLRREADDVLRKVHELAIHYEAHLLDPRSETSGNDRRPSPPPL